MDVLTTVFTVVGTFVSLSVPWYIWFARKLSSLEQRLVRVETKLEYLEKLILNNDRGGKS